MKNLILLILFSTIALSCSINEQNNENVNSEIEAYIEDLIITSNLLKD